ncbi:MAG: hypothetical protein DMF81_21530 [Acidobacteria bacterium]|nr:MAG: hypothetical protein DMF81_21530 [Acidobacteriota bacterium]
MGAQEECPCQSHAGRSCTRSVPRPRARLPHSSPPAAARRTPPKARRRRLGAPPACSFSTATRTRWARGGRPWKRSRAPSWTPDAIPPTRGPRPPTCARRSPTGSPSGPRTWPWAPAPGSCCAARSASTPPRRATWSRPRPRSSSRRRWPSSSASACAACRSTRARWAGLIFFCNPNNPTSTVHPARAVTEFVTRVRKESPDTAILIDEAYHDYVTDPGYATAVPLALEHPNVVVTRTLSKAYGMAGMRIGYAVGQPRAIENFNRWGITFNQNSLAVAAAVASLGDPAHIDAERARNTEARAFTTRFFQDLGCRVMDSQANFLFVETGRPAREFKEACARRGILVGRAFPPLDKSHARVSIGTVDEMQRAGVVIAEVLGAGRPVPAAASSPSRPPR